MTKYLCTANKQGKSIVNISIQILFFKDTEEDSPRRRLEEFISHFILAMDKSLMILSMLILLFGLFGKTSGDVSKLKATLSGRFYFVLNI